MRNKNLIPSGAKVAFKVGDTELIGYVGYRDKRGDPHIYVKRNHYSSVKDWYNVCENELTRIKV